MVMQKYNLWRKKGPCSLYRERGIMTNMEMKAKERIRFAGQALLSMQRHSWEQGLAMQAFYETGNMDTVICLAYEAVYRAMPDGRTATIGVTDAVTDPASVGEALLAACKKTGDEYLIQGEKKLREWVCKHAPRSGDGCLYHLLTGREYWADSMYMLPPYLAAIGEKYEAVRQFSGYWSALYDDSSGLVVHKWDDGKKHWSDPLHWGIGNGWCLMAISRLYGLLKGDPSCSDACEELSEKGRILLRNVLDTRSQDGRFHNVLDDPDTFEETGIAQMCAYTIYRGLRDGWLAGSDQQRREWMETADALRQSAEEKQDVYGFIHEVCGAPTFDKSGTAPEQQAVFMMMEYAYLSLL